MSDWIETPQDLRLELRTPDFMSGVDLVRRIAEVAEAQNHHPDLELGWGYLRIRLSTHDSGGVTERDRRLAEALSPILETLRA
ncbi:MAG: 4a-hydroxytetrahydrobiopterin dehydratase [Acidobacteria bacterium]|nr:4a-hydroxytetrahydrobiopterin dehydratase [Acidobacteriota bacterium]